VSGNLRQFRHPDGVLALGIEVAAVLGARVVQLETRRLKIKEKVEQKVNGSKPT
jgi:hypothetical protein